MLSSTFVSFTDTFEVIDECMPVVGHAHAQAFAHVGAYGCPQLLGVENFRVKIKNNVSLNCVIYVKHPTVFTSLALLK